MPTKHISSLITRFALCSGVTLTDMPHSFTVETMVRKPGAISDLQTAEVILDNLKSTLAFDATTQEAYTLPPKVIAMSSLVMSNNWRYGWGLSYTHLCSIVNLANLYCYFHDEKCQTIWLGLISNTLNSLIDCCAVNHAAIQIVNASWDKILNELNCHLHPLDYIDTREKSALFSGTGMGKWFLCFKNCCPDEQNVL